MRNLNILFFIAFSMGTMAQTNLIKPEVYIGTSHGVTASMLLFKPAVSQGYLLGYNGGIVFRYITEKNVGMQVELNYSQRGWEEKSGLYTRQLNYIELPFMTHIFVGKKNRFFFNIGPKISYLLSEKVLINNTIASADEETQHITPVQNTFDYGLCAGFGILFNIKGNVYQLDTRTNYGLSDVFSNDKRDYFDTSNNLNIAINLAWLLQLK